MPGGFRLGELSRLLGHARLSASKSVVATAAVALAPFYVASRPFYRTPI